MNILQQKHPACPEVLDTLEAHSLIDLNGKRMIVSSEEHGEAQCHLMWTSGFGDTISSALIFVPDGYPSSLALFPVVWNGHLTEIATTLFGVELFVIDPNTNHGLSSLEDILCFCGEHSGSKELPDLCSGANKDTLWKTIIANRAAVDYHMETLVMNISTNMAETLRRFIECEKENENLKQQCASHRKRIASLIEEKRQMETTSITVQALREQCSRLQVTIAHKTHDLDHLTSENTRIKQHLEKWAIKQLVSKNDGVDVGEVQILLRSSGKSRAKGLKKFGLPRDFHKQVSQFLKTHHLPVCQ